MSRETGFLPGVLPPAVVHRPALTQAKITHLKVYIPFYNAGAKTQCA